MILCEAAGFDTVFIETVGVGQSEVLGARHGGLLFAPDARGRGRRTARHQKGHCGVSDLIAVTKADGDNHPKAEAAKLQLERIVEFLPKITPEWTPKVFYTSALPKSANSGLRELWRGIEEFAASAKKTELLMRVARTAGAVA